MAAGFLITRILLVCLLSEVHYCSALPRARRFVYPKALWDGINDLQEGYGYWNRRPLQYIRNLRQSSRSMQPNVVYDQVPVITWQKPRASFGMVSSQKQPSLHHQTLSQFQPRSDVGLKRPQEMSPPQRSQLLPKPRGFEFKLSLPSLNFFGQKKGTGSPTKGSGLNSVGIGGADPEPYRPSSVQIESSFNSPSGSHGIGSKGSSKGPYVGQTVHEVSKPTFELSLSVPIPTTTPSPSTPSSNGVQQGQEGFGFIRHSQVKLVKPQSTYPQTGSKWPFTYSSGTGQQQTQQKTYEPGHTRPTDDKLSFPFGYYNQHTTPTEPVSQGKIPTEPKPGQSPSLLIPKYPQYNSGVGGYYSTQTDPTSQDYSKGKTDTTDYTNLALSSSSSLYGSVQSGPYSGNNNALSYSAGTMQQQTQQQTYKPVFTKPTDLPTFPSGYYSQQMTPTGPGSQGKTPIKLFPKPAVTKQQSSTLPIQKYPQQYGASDGGYYTTQMDPTRRDYGWGSPGTTLSQYEGARGGRYSGNYYAQGQTSKPASTSPTFPSGQYPDNMLKKYVECKQFLEKVPHLSSGRPSSPSQYDTPSSGFYNREVAATTNYEVGNEMQPGQKYTSSFPYRYGTSQSGRDHLHDHLSTVGHLQKFHSLTDPGQDVGKQKLNGGIKYIKPYTDMKDITAGTQGQSNYFTAPTHYDGYTGTWTGQNTAEPPIKSPNPPFTKFPSQVSGSQGQFPKMVNSTYPSVKPDIPPYNQIPCSDGQCSYYPEKQVEPDQIQTYSPYREPANPSPYVGATDSFPPNSYQQQPPHSSLNRPMMNIYNPSNAQYPAGPTQPQQPTIDGCDPYDPSYYPGKKCNILVL